MQRSWSLARCLWAANYVQFAPLRPPHASVPSACSMHTCFRTVAMSPFAVSVAAPISPPPAPARSVLALLRALGLLLIQILSPGATGAFPYDSPPLLSARARGDLGELSSTDSSVEHATL